MRVNGLTSTLITKLDVLSGFERVAIVTGYRLRDEPVGFEAAAEPNLVLDLAWYDGWSEDLSAFRKIGDLPAAARTYVAALGNAIGVPIDGVSLGPERSSMALP